MASLSTVHTAPELDTVMSPLSPSLSEPPDAAHCGLAPAPCVCKKWPLVPAPSRVQGAPGFAAANTPPCSRSPRTPASIRLSGPSKTTRETNRAEKPSLAAAQVRPRSLDRSTLSVSAGLPVTARVTVTNTGPRAGTETVHLYYQDMVCEERVPRLLERLGHQQVTLEPGDSAVLSFAVTPVMLAKYGRVPDAGPRVWPDRDPAENPDRLFLVQHEGHALDAIERFGEAPCVLPFTVVP